MKKLIEVQALLKAPKGQFNKFGNYNYRSCEDIIEAAKPLLNERGLLLTISDTIVNIGDRFYVEATATVTDGEQTITTKAYAREEETKKGMDGAQITGAASSYARKYALNGLFAIDDNKDGDATNTHVKQNKAQKQPAPQPQNTNNFIDKKQVATLQTLIKQYNTDVSKMLKFFGVANLESMTQSQFKKAIAVIKK